ncbi:MAG: cytochrome C [Campylobacterota bacterium]
MKLLKLLTVVATLVLFVDVSVQADEKKGQKIIIIKLKDDCGMNGAILAKKHTQDEWKAINDDGSLPAEIQKICPNSKPLKEKYYPHVYDFLYNYALDSGKVPSC